MRKLLLPTLFIALAVASFLVYTMPAYDEVRQLKADIEEYDSALAHVSEIQKIQSALRSQSDQLSAVDRYLLNEILPSAFDKVHFLIGLNQIALTNGLTVSEVSYGGSSNTASEAEASTEPYDSSLVTFQTSGSYEDVMAFVRDVEQSARLMDIVEFAVSGESGSESDGETSGLATPPSGEQNTYQFTVKTYWMPDEAEAATSQSAEGDAPAGIEGAGEAGPPNEIPQ